MHTSVNWTSEESSFETCALDTCEPVTKFIPWLLCVSSSLGHQCLTHGYYPKKKTCVELMIERTNKYVHEYVCGPYPGIPPSV